MARGYYYLISALPELSLTDKRLDFNMVTYREFVQDQLHPDDLFLFKAVYYRYDILNLVNLIKGNNKSWLPEGNATPAEMREKLDQPDLLPSFMRQFVFEKSTTWKAKGEKRLINKATGHFVDWVLTLPNTFLHKWLLFDVNLKNLLIWLNSYKFNLDPAGEIIGSHYEAEYLRKTKREEIDLKSWDFRYREVMTHFDNPNIALREFIINEMRWHYLNELEEAYTFGIERLIAFAIRLQLIDRNLRTTEDDGRKQLKNLLKNIRGGYEMPTTFNENTSTEPPSLNSIEQLINAPEAYLQSKPS
jgi:hypothetical protein